MGPNVAVSRTRVTNFIKNALWLEGEQQKSSKWVPGSAPGGKSGGHQTLQITVVLTPGGLQTLRFPMNLMYFEFFDLQKISKNIGNRCV